MQFSGVKLWGFLGHVFACLFFAPYFIFLDSSIAAAFISSPNQREGGQGVSELVFGETVEMDDHNIRFGADFIPAEGFAVIANVSLTCSISDHHDRGHNNHLSHRNCLSVSASLLFLQGLLHTLLQGLIGHLQSQGGRRREGNRVFSFAPIQQ